MEMLRTKRREANLSQQALAELSGVPQQTISMIETGERTPGVDIAYKLSIALHCTIEELMGRKPVQ